MWRTRTGDAEQLKKKGNKNQMAKKKETNLAKRAGKLLLTVDETAEILSLTAGEVRSLDSNGILGPPSIKLGHNGLFRQAELIDWVSSGCPNRQEWETQKVKSHRPQG